VEPKKGLRVLLEAFAQLQRVHGVSGCQLLIVGDGPARTMLESLRDRLGLTDRVIFAGTRRDLPQVLSLLDVFVLPSLYEGFGIAILEAMAAGKPVIATAVGGIPEFVEHARTGVLVPPGDSMALASAIKEMIVCPARAKSMGCHAQAYVRKHHTIEASVRQHEDLYELCLSQT
jgi:glycosyltransferase involved in cell wall biosynthesis